MALADLIEDALPNARLTLTVGLKSSEIELKRPRGRQAVELRRELMDAAPAPDYAERIEAGDVQPAEANEWYARMEDVAAKWLSVLYVPEKGEARPSYDDACDVVRASAGALPVFEALAGFFADDPEVSSDDVKFRDGGS